MSTRTTRFRELSWPGRKNLPCPSCGKKVRRQRTFTQTLNPWNRNAAGEPKSPQEIYAELKAKAEAWESEAVMCTPCTDKDDKERRAELAEHIGHRVELRQADGTVLGRGDLASVTVTGGARLVRLEAGRWLVPLAAIATIVRLQVRQDAGVWPAVQKDGADR